MHFTLWPSLTSSEGRHGEIAWENFVQFVASPVIAEDKQALAGWSPIRSRGSRRGSAHVEAVSCIVLDDDASGLSTEQVAAICAGASGVVHTSFSHTPEHPKHRIVLRCSRDMAPDEYPRVWRFIRDAATARGQRLDEAPKDASRFWYVPGRREGAPYAWCELAGAPLDVDAILARAPVSLEGTTAPSTVPLTYDPTRSSEASDVKDRGRAVAAMLGSAWPAKGRHEAQLALAGALRAEGWPEADALEFLCTVCRVAGDEDRPKREATIRHTYERAADAPLTGWTRLKTFVDGVVVDAARGALNPDAGFAETMNRRLAEVRERRPPEITPTGGIMIDGLEFETGGYDEELPPIDWQIDGLVACGDVVMLVAQGNSLKTWLAFSVAHAIASGRPWLGRYYVKQGRVGILDWESGKYEVRRRLRLLGVKQADVGDRLIRCSYPGIDLSKVESWLTLAKLRLDHVIVDSFHASVPGTDEADAKADLALQQAGKFAELTNCTASFIHHSRKGQGGDRRESVRGNTSIYGACDRIFEFVDLEKKDGGVVLSTMTSIKDGAGERPKDVRVQLSNSGLQYVDVPQDEEKQSNSNRAIAMRLLRSNPSGAPKADLENMLKGAVAARREFLSSLVLAGETVEYTTGRKVYVMLNPNNQHDAG